jgi:hypothetical protein
MSNQILPIRIGDILQSTRLASLRSAICQRNETFVAEHLHKLTFYKKNDDEDTILNKLSTYTDPSLSVASRLLGLQILKEKDGDNFSNFEELVNHIHEMMEIPLHMTITLLGMEYYSTWSTPKHCNVLHCKDADFEHVLQHATHDLACHPTFKGGSFIYIPDGDECEVNTIYFAEYTGYQLLLYTYWQLGQTAAGRGLQPIPAGVYTGTFENYERLFQLFSAPNKSDKYALSQMHELVQRFQQHFGSTNQVMALQIRRTVDGKHRTPSIYRIFGMKIPSSSLQHTRSENAIIRRYVTLMSYASHTSTYNQIARIYEDLDTVTKPYHAALLLQATH